MPLGLELMTMLAPIASLAGGIGLGVALRVLIDRYVQGIPPEAPPRIHLAALRLARGYVLLWCVLASLEAASTLLPLHGTIREWLGRIILALAYSSFIVFLIGTSSRLLRRFAERIEGLRPVENIVERVIQITFAVLGGLLVLNTLTVPITPLLTTLGIAGLATALALQDTLSNFFAGFYLLADRPIRAGDFIKLDSGNEGYVRSVGWRTTKLRTLANNIVVLPNSKVSAAIITNYSLPGDRMGASVRVGVSYDADLDQAERVLTEIVQEAIGTIPGLLPDPAPAVIFDPGFGELGFEFTIGFQVAQYVDQFAIRNELRKRAYRRFREEGIGLPIPARTIRMDDRPASQRAALGNASPPADPSLQ